MSKKRLRIDTTDDDGVQYESNVVQRRDENGGTRYAFGEGRLVPRTGSGYIDIQTAIAHDFEYTGDGEVQTTDGKLPYNKERGVREVVLKRTHKDIDYTAEERLVIIEIPEKLVDRN